MLQDGELKEGEWHVYDDRVQGGLTGGTDGVASEEVAGRRSRHGRHATNPSVRNREVGRRQFPTSVLPPSPVRRGGDQLTVTQTVVVARATAAVIESPVLTDDGSTDGYLVHQEEARGARVR